MNIKRYKYFDVSHDKLEETINAYAIAGYKLISFTCYENNFYSIDINTSKLTRMYAVIMEYPYEDSTM